jgi:predicted metalloprotease with PDZ domain
MAVLALACVLLFRPGMVMDRLADPYIEANPVHLITKGIKGQEIRVEAKLLRSQETRWLTLKPVAGAKDIRTKTLGLTLRKQGEDGFAVTTVKFNGPAQKAGLNFGDLITKVKVANPARYSQRWFYLPAFLLVALAGYFNWRRARQ